MNSSRLHWGGGGAAWFRCCSNRTDPLYVRMRKKRRYKFRSFTMVRRLQRPICQEDISLGLIVPHVNLCCFDYPYSSASKMDPHCLNITTGDLATGPLVSVVVPNTARHPFHDCLTHRNAQCGELKDRSVRLEIDVEHRTTEIENLTDQVAALQGKLEENRLTISADALTAMTQECNRLRLSAAQYRFWCGPVSSFSGILQSENWYSGF